MTTTLQTGQRQPWPRYEVYYSARTYPPRAFYDRDRERFVKNAASAYLGLFTADRVDMSLRHAPPAAHTR